MTLYQIDAALQELIERCTDPETGDITEVAEELDSLQMAREDKIENIALYYKNLTAEAEMVKLEADKLTKRRRSLERTAERMKEMLDRGLDGAKFTTARVVVSFNTSKSVEIDTESFLPWAAARPQYLRFKDPEPDKAIIRSAINQGMTIPGARIVEKRSVTVK